MATRLIAVLVLLAVLPTLELAEQTIHFVEHVLEAESPAHSAHEHDRPEHAARGDRDGSQDRQDRHDRHDDSQGDEHGCTSLVHLCTCHHAQVMASSPVTAPVAVETPDTLIAELPPPLFDLHAIEPPQRPPNA